MSLQAIPSLLLILLLCVPASWQGGTGTGNGSCMLPDESVQKIQPICVPSMQHKEMRQGSAVAHTYFKYFPFFFFLRVVLTFSLKQGKTGCPKASSSSI